MNLQEFNAKFRIVPTGLLDLPRDLSESDKPEGDCQDYAKSVKAILDVKFPKAIMIRCWSDKPIPRHAVLWVKGRGFIDSTVREFRKTPLPHIPAWPVGTPAIAAAVYVFGVWNGWCL